MTHKILISNQPIAIQAIKDLYAQDKDVVFYCMTPEFAKQLHDLDLPAMPLGADLKTDIRGLAARYAAGILRGMQVPISDAVHPACMSFMANDYGGFIYPRLIDLAAISLAVDETKPDIAIVHNDVEPALRAVAFWCKSHGVPCVHIPHAVYCEWGRGPLGTDVHDLITASHICVAGPFQDEWYRKLGGNTVVTGLPCFDPWAHTQFNKASARNALGLEQNKPIILYRSSWRQDTNLLGCHDGVEEAYVNFLTVSKTMPDVQFIIMPHWRAQPAQIEWHLKIAQEMDAPCMVTAQYPQVCQIASDAILAYGPSGALFESSFVEGLKLMSIAGFKEDPEVLTITESVKDITEAIQTVLAMNALTIPTKTFQYKYVGVPDGMAHARIAELIRSLL